jgi:hypothetical protein
MRRLIAPLSILMLVVLAGCGSTPAKIASSTSPVEPAVASSPPQAASQAAPETASPTEAPVLPSEAPSSAPVAGGTATDFCGAFKELEAMSQTNPSDLASAGAQFQSAAADMRKYAPAEVQQAANTYADLIDSIGKAVANGSVGEASLSKAISDGMAGNAKDIGKVAVWVAKNCDF